MIFILNVSHRFFKLTAASQRLKGKNKDDDTETQDPSQEEIKRIKELKITEHPWMLIFLLGHLCRLFICHITVKKETFRFRYVIIPNYIRGIFTLLKPFSPKVVF